MKKKFISNNEIEKFSFHDCYITQAEKIKDSLILTLNYVDVLSEHELNPYPKAMQTGKAKIIIEKFEFVKAEISYSDLDSNLLMDKLNEDMVIESSFVRENIIERKESELIKIFESSRIHYFGMESNNLLCFEIDPEDSNYIPGMFYSECKHSNVQIVWNEYIKASHFEREGSFPEIQISM